MKRLMLATGAAAVALMLAGPAAVPQAWAQAKETIVIDLVNEPSSLDPHMQWNPDSYYVYRNVFDNMVTRDDDGEIIPQVATSWEYLSDTEVAFTIRDDITFHDGTPLTAEDVAFSVNRIINPDFGSPQLGQFNKITGAEATDDTTVVITTDGPYPVLLAQLVKLSIVPMHHVEEVGDEQFNLEPMGSGPYAFDSWQRGVQVTLVRNDDYWGDMGPFERAEFRAVPDAATRVANLQAGESDLVVSLNQDLATQIEGDPAVKPLIVNTERVAFLRLNTQIPPTDDPRVREAIAHAIDKEGLTVGLLGGYPEPVDIMPQPGAFRLGRGHGRPRLRPRGGPRPPGGGRRRGRGRDGVCHRPRLRPAHRPGAPADAGRCRAERVDRDDRHVDLSRPGAQRAHGRAAHEFRPVVLRLPGRRRRAVPAAAFVEQLVGGARPGPRRRSGGGAQHPRRRGAPGALPRRP